MMDQPAVVTAIQDATREVFTTMLSLEISDGESYLEKVPPGPSDGVIAVVGMAGKWICTGSMLCSGALARRLSSQLLMTEFDEVSEEVLDAVAEVTNMIVGNFKNAAEPYLGPLGLTIPTVIYGMQFLARSAERENWTVVPFKCGDESLIVKLLLTPNRGFSHLAPHKIPGIPSQ